MNSFKRFGLVIGADPEKIGIYKLHFSDNLGVQDILVKYSIRIFSIFISQFPDGQEYLFGCFEYTGNNYQSDMRMLSEEPRNIEWLKLCDPCQKPFNGDSSWCVMDEIYHNG